MEEEAPAELDYDKMLDDHTYANLKDLAKANGMKIKGNIKKSDLVNQIASEIERSIVEAYFEG